MRGIHSNHVRTDRAREVVDFDGEAERNGCTVTTSDKWKKKQWDGMDWNTMISVVIGWSHGVFLFFLVNGNTNDPKSPFKTLMSDTGHRDTLRDKTRESLVDEDTLDEDECGHRDGNEDDMQEMVTRRTTAAVASDDSSETIMVI